jgi:hypothetical protein
MISPESARFGQSCWSIELLGRVRTILEGVVLALGYLTRKSTKSGLTARQERIRVWAFETWRTPRQAGYPGQGSNHKARPKTARVKDQDAIVIRWIMNLVLRPPCVLSLSATMLQSLRESFRDSATLMRTVDVDPRL